MDTLKYNLTTTLEYWNVVNQLITCLNVSQVRQRGRDNGQWQAIAAGKLYGFFCCVGVPLEIEMGNYSLQVVVDTPVGGNILIIRVVKIIQELFLLILGELENFILTDYIRTLTE